MILAPAIQDTQKSTGSQNANFRFSESSADKYHAIKTDDSTNNLVSEHTDVKDKSKVSALAASSKHQKDRGKKIN